MANELRLAQARIALSRAQADLLARVMPGRCGPLEVLPAPSAGRLESRAEAPAGAELRLAHWGNLYDLKGVEELIEAVGRAVKEIPVRLDIYGRASEPEFLRRLEEAARNKPVTLHGPYRREELAQVSAHLAVFPSRCWETYGLVVDEAFMLGLPVLVTRSGALPERIGRGGVVVEPGDVAALTATIIRLGRERGELAKLAAGVGRCWSTGAQVAAQAEELYGRILAGKGTAMPPVDQVTQEERLHLYWYVAALRQASLAGSPIVAPPPWRQSGECQEPTTG
jgi:glycosyltransferase involved in cell wall biosynthesis